MPGVVCGQLIRGHALRRGAGRPDTRSTRADPGALAGDAALVTGRGRDAAGTGPSSRASPRHSREARAGDAGDVDHRDARHHREHHHHDEEVRQPQTSRCQTIDWTRPVPSAPAAGGRCCAHRPPTVGFTRGEPIDSAGTPRILAGLPGRRAGSRAQNHRGRRFGRGAGAPGALGWDFGVRHCVRVRAVVIARYRAGRLGKGGDGATGKDARLEGGSGLGSVQGHLRCGDGDRPRAGGGDRVRSTRAIGAPGDGRRSRQRQSVRFLGHLATGGKARCM